MSAAKLLVVDDDATDRTAAVRCLAGEDVEVVEAASGADAVALMESEMPDAVLTDLRMPGITGLELVQMLRERYPHVPVVLMTSMGNERTAVLALQAGAVSYVPKAELEAQLPETIGAVLELAAERRGEKQLVAHLVNYSSEFLLPNDPMLVLPAVNWAMAAMQRCLFGDETGRNQVGMALSEALSNAMIHGNLDLSSDLRDRDRFAYDEQIALRRQQSPYRERRVRCAMRIDAAELQVRIQDEGKGFDFLALPDPTQPANLLKARGRGVFLIRTFMDEVEFMPPGNVVTLRKFRT